MKKLLALLLAVACLLGLTACGEKLEEPPQLRLTWNGGETVALRGGHDWSVQNGLGAASSTIACGAHPLQCKDLLGGAPDVPAGVVSLNFAVKPDRISSVRCWSDQYWGGDPDTPSEEPALDGFELYLKEGSWVYALTACWEGHGNCEYIFYLTFTPPVPSQADSSAKPLETPPELRIAAGDGAVTSSKGTYSWSYFNGYGWPTIEADSIHPLEYEDIVETLTTADNTVTLEFDVPPDSITAEECWSDAHWGSTGAESESFELDGSEITLKPGGYIYTIRARWDAEGYNGSCRYVFHVVCPE